MFSRAVEVAYLDTAGEGLPLADCPEALMAYFEDKSLGTPGRRRFHEQEHAAMCGVARLLGAPVSDVALLATASDALNLFANSIEWRPGDEVVVSDLEFPSGVLAWLRLRQRGVQVRVVASRKGAVSLDQFAAAIGPATRVVCVSHVSYKTGARIPFLRELSDLAHAHGAMLVVDATQSLGRTPVLIEGVDFLVASTYKWLLGVHGLAVVYLAPAARARISEGALGWYSLTEVFTPDRFERYEMKSGAGWMMTGMPAFPSIYALRQSVDFLLAVDIRQMDEQLKPVIESLREGGRQLGLEPLTPHDPDSASGIVSFVHPECNIIGAQLEKEGVIVWAGDGRLRASVHFYNDAEDIERFLEVIATITGQEYKCGTRS